MGDWINKNLPCFECGSSDAMQESEHHFKCFSCSKTFLKREMNNFYVENNRLGSKMTQKSNIIEKGNYYDLKQRGLSKQTCQKYGITCTKYSGTFGHGDSLHYLNEEWIYVFNYYHNNNIIKQKLRPCNEKIYKILGDTTFKEFYGQSIFKIDPNRILIITEGEFEAPVIYQETGFYAISVPDGAGSLIRCLINNYDYVSGFKYLIFALDNDEPSNKEITKLLQHEIVNKLGPGKVKIAYWPMKDSNELLLAGRSPDIKKTLWDAEEYRPKDLFTAIDLIDYALIKPLPGVKTPWEGLTSAISGWRENTISTIAAADGIGKTEFADEIIYSFIKNNLKIWLYSCEQEPEETLRRQAGKDLNLPLHIPGVPWNEEKMKESIMKLDEKLIMWRPEKSTGIDELISKMEYASVAYGIKYFIIDHLKGIESQMTDINNGMGRFLSNLKFFAKTNNVCIILLSHVAKDKKQGRVGKDDESWNRGRVPTKENIYGSSAISAWSDVILALSRNVEAEAPEEACITKISILKNRLMGNRGQKAIWLKYIEDTGRLVEIEPVDLGWSNVNAK